MTKYIPLLQPKKPLQSETLYDVWERSNHKNNDEKKRSFNDIDNNGDDIFTETTGISFIDAAVSMSRFLGSGHNDNKDDPSSATATKTWNNHTNSIILDIIGSTASGKTCTLFNIVARYLLKSHCTPTISPKRCITKTASSLSLQQQQRILPKEKRIDNNDKDTHRSDSVLNNDDNNNNSTSTNNSSNDDMTLQEQELQQRHHQTVLACLQRLHFVTPSISQHQQQDMSSFYIYVLETLRHELQKERKSNTSSPILLVWDDFLDEPIFASTTIIPSPSIGTTASISAAATRMDVIRQVQRLLQSYKNIILITSSSTQTYSNRQYYNSYPSSTAVLTDGPQNNLRQQKRFIGGKEWNRYVTCSIHLEKQQQMDGRYVTITSPGNHTNISRYMATVTLSNNLQNKNNNNKSRNNTVVNDQPLPLPQSIPFLISNHGIVF